MSLYSDQKGGKHRLRYREVCDNVILSLRHRGHWKMLVCSEIRSRATTKLRLTVKTQEGCCWKSVCPLSLTPRTVGRPSFSEEGDLVRWYKAMRTCWLREGKAEEVEEMRKRTNEGETKSGKRLREREMTRIAVDRQRVCLVSFLVSLAIFARSGAADLVRFAGERGAGGTVKWLIVLLCVSSTWPRFLILRLIRFLFHFPNFQLNVGVSQTLSFSEKRSVRDMFVYDRVKKARMNVEGPKTVPNKTSV